MAAFCTGCGRPLDAHGSCDACISSVAVLPPQQRLPERVTPIASPTDAADTASRSKPRLVAGLAVLLVLTLIVAVSAVVVATAVSMVDAAGRPVAGMVGSSSDSTGNPFLGPSIPARRAGNLTNG